MLTESESQDHDESFVPEMFRAQSGLLDSLDKLTNEIKEDLLSLEATESETGSNESSNDDFDSDDENEYSDDEDPDSGETKLYSMMDELVMELQKELEGGGTEEECDHVTEDKPGKNEASDVSVEQHTSVDDEKKEEDAGERHEKLHENVKTLLQQVTMMKKAVNVDTPKNMKNMNHDKISANIQRKIEQGDYDADRLEHLMGAISTHVTMNATRTRYYNKIKKQKRKKRTNKHKKRKPKPTLQTQQQSLHILFDSLSTLDQKLSRESLPRH